MRPLSFDPPAPNAALLELLALVAGSARLAILEALAAGPSDVTALAAQLDLDVPTASRSLGQLRRAGLVHWVGQGHRRFYRLGPGAVAVPRRDGLMLRMIAAGGGALTLTLPKDGSGRTLGV